MNAYDCEECRRRQRVRCPTCGKRSEYMPPATHARLNRLVEGNKAVCGQDSNKKHIHWALPGVLPTCFICHRKVLARRGRDA